MGQVKTPTHTKSYDVRGTMVLNRVEYFAGKSVKFVRVL